MTPAELIKRSYYLAQVLDPSEEIDGFQASEGMFTLNEIINQWSSLSIYIPTYTIIPISLMAGVFSYTINPCITQLNEAHLIDQNNVQFPLDIIDLERFNVLNFSLPNNQGRPYSIFVQNDFENYPTQSQVVFYRIPDNSYSVTLYAMVRLAEMSYSTEITTVPPYMLKGLRYELAHELSEINGTILPPSFYEKYDKIINQVIAANKRDKRVKTHNVFQQIRRYRPWRRYAG